TYNKNKLYITPHSTPIYTSRVLSEKDIHSSIYNKDADMKSVKESFDDRTSQRLEENDKRMQDKRQKRKEERDKNIQKIIKKDKMEKSLAEKVEKECLRCGCALGGGVLPVWGLVSGLWYATLSQYVSQTAIQKGTEGGISVAIQGVTDKFPLGTLGGEALQAVITSKTYNQPMFFVKKFVNEYYRMYDNGTLSSNSFFNSIKLQFPNDPSKILPSITANARDVATNAGNAAKISEAAEVTKLAPHTSILSNTIIASVVAIVVIVLVAIIIYLILRYRRKKK
ncbi:rifin, partial [Plasmodium reichenowi]